MPSNAYTGEVVGFGMAVALHVIFCVWQFYHLAQGSRPTRVSRVPIYAAMCATGFEVIRAVDPSAAFGRYSPQLLQLWGHPVTAAILVGTTQVTYQAIGQLFMEATGMKRKRSKGLRKMKRESFVANCATVFWAFLTAILAIVTRKELWIGLWGIWIGGVLLLVMLNLILGGRWLRRRLRKHFRSKFPDDRAKVKRLVKSYVERLTYFRYSVIALCILAFIVILIFAARSLLSYDDDIERVDNQEYEFFNYWSIWVQWMCLNVMFWYGWIPRRREERPSQRRLTKEERERLKEERRARESEDFKLAQRLAAFQKSTSATTNSSDKADKEGAAASPSSLTVDAVELKSNDDAEPENPAGEGEFKVEEDTVDDKPVMRIDTRVAMQMEQAKRFGFAVNTKPLTAAERTASTESDVDKQRAALLKQQKSDSQARYREQFEESDHEISDDEIRASSH